MLRGAGPLEVVVAVFSLFVSQLPYRRVWLYGSTFAYDAPSDFYPVFSYLLDELLAGRGILSVNHEILGNAPLLSYVYQPFIQVLGSLLLPNDYSSFAHLQAFHSALTFVAFVVLVRSFGVSLAAASGGALVFTLAGIHLSLSQHVLGHETLFYVVMLLFVLRVLVFRFEELNGWKRAGFALAAAFLAVNAARMPADAVSYFIPIVGWVVGHLYFAVRANRLRLGVQVATTLAAIVVVTIVASVPQLLVFAEMKDLNTTLVSSYAETGRYFEDGRVFFGSLVFPNINGSTPLAAGLGFRLSTDPTLAYIFGGTIALYLALVATVMLLREGKRGQAVVGIGTVTLSLGFAFGVGSPIHYFLTQVFPPLGMLHHYYYGMHIFYLAVGVLAAFGLDFASRLTKSDHKAFVLWPAALISIGVLCLWRLLLSQPVAGLIGNIRLFELVTQVDVLRGLLFIAAAASAVLLLRRAPHAMRQMALPVLVTLIAVEMMLPVWRAHFVPGSKFPMERAKYFQGSDSGAAEAILRRLEIEGSNKELAWRRPRVLGIDIHHFGNLPMLMGMNPLRGGGTQGNRGIDANIARLKDPGLQSEEKCSVLAQLGSDYVWYKGRENPELSGMAQRCLRKVVTTDWIGELYQFEHRSYAADRERESVLELSWWRPDSSTRHTKDLWGDKYEVELPTDGRVNAVDVVLPINFLSYFSVSDQSGLNYRHSMDNYGRVTVTKVAPSSQRLILRYPAQALSSSLVVSSIIYGICVVGLFIVIIPFVRDVLQRIHGKSTAALD
jgi:hypothetical protein